tara:strand:+ start:381 stop:548 length:168 start_codon:yes stop_codon:yes gene_type:complete
VRLKYSYYINTQTALSEAKGSIDTELAKYNNMPDILSSDEFETLFKKIISNMDKK